MKMVKEERDYYRPRWPTTGQSDDYYWRVASVSKQWTSLPLIAGTAG